MTVTNLKTGSHVWRLVGSNVRWVVLLAALGMVCVDVASAQQALASVLPNDSANARKSSRARAEKIKSDFAASQIENERVLAARIDKRLELKKLFRERGLTYPAAEIFIRVFKREHTLELWVRPEAADTFIMFKAYDICALGEKPGPKRVQGDLQTPEGYYWIDDFNPRSGYHLSLGVDYPNASDKVLGAGKVLGGDIFIHGGCKTAGCLAVTDDNIKEIYWLAVEARDHGQTRIPVHIFPARLTDDALANLVRVFEQRPDLTSFWANLKPGFDLFEKDKKLPTVTVNRRGRYQYNVPVEKPAEKKELLGTPVVAPATASN